MTTLTGERRAENAREFLTASEREFSAGDVAQGSEKLWGAAAQAVIAVAQQRGWKYGSHRDIKTAIERLATEQGDNGLASNFAVAEKFHANFYHEFMQEFELEQDAPKVHSLVNRVLALLD